MNKEKYENHQNEEVTFESHPPIVSDIEPVANLLKQTYLDFIDCHSLAEHLVRKSDVTQILALESIDKSDDDTDNNDDDDDNDEGDDNIYGVVSIVNLKKDDDPEYQKKKKELVDFMKSKSSRLTQILESSEDVGLLINERFINLPAQLSLPTFKHLSNYLDQEHYKYFVFFSRLFLKTHLDNDKLKKKRQKTAANSSSTLLEPIIYVNAEDEIICETCDSFIDIDVSKKCDENASWSVNGDVKLTPQRRIIIVECSKWNNILSNLEKELS